MKKISLSLFRWLYKILPKWINLQNVVFFAVITAFIIIILWSEKISRYVISMRMQEGIITPTSTILPGTPTPPLPAEYIASADQTSGIMIGVIIVMATILAGTLIILWRDIKKQN